jgi:hypothetical protein
MKIPFLILTIFLQSNVVISITAGRIRARKELSHAPISAIRRSRCGTSAESPPEIVKVKNYGYCK